MSQPSPSFDEILADCLAALEHEGSGALESACAAHPDLAERLRRRVRLLAAADLIDADGALDRLPERLGDFEPLERLGEGGMGVVHLARQASTGRLVALKLVRPGQLLFPEARARFRREVELCARLHHPGIVSVLAVGETRGVPWFAMELVRGTSLASLLAALRERAGDPAAIARELPARLVHELTPAALREEPPPPFAASWRAWSLRAVRDVARALAYAHAHGVLHRDIKPSNVLVAGDGRVLLSDFGLASRPGEGSLTRSSEAVGSLAYMAPETLAGQGASTRADVYGLGALLYELATLRRPFEAPSAPALVRAVLAGELAAPRRLAPRMGADEEAVCLRALERVPERRYAGAAELAADLDNLLERRPTQARPAGPLRRAWRAAQRRPARALALALGALALVAGPVGWELNRLRTARELREAYDNERRAHALSERHFQAALAAVGHVLRELATDELEDAPRMQLVRLEAIERAGELFAELERDRPDDPAVLREGARLSASRADVLEDLGRLDEAVLECRRARGSLARLLAAEPTADLRVALAQVLNLECRILQLQLQHAPALELQAECVAELRLALLGGGSEQSVGDLVVALANRAESEAVALGREAALATLAEAEALGREHLARRPQEASAHRQLAQALVARGRFECLSGRLDEADLLAREGLELERRALALAPGERAQAFDLASALGSVADIARARHDREEEVRLVEEAVALLGALRRDFPESLRFRREHRSLRDRRASAIGALGRREEALGLYTELLAEAQEELERAPDRCDTRGQAAQAANNLANCLIHLRRDLERARALSEQGLTLLAPCLSVGQGTWAPELEWKLRYQGCLARCLGGGDPERALEAVAAFDAAAGEDAVRLRFAADLWTEWLLAARRARLPAPAVEDLVAAPPDEGERAARERVLELLERAVERGYDDVQELRTTESLAPLRADPAFEDLLRRAQAAAARRA